MLNLQSRRFFLDLFSRAYALMLPRLCQKGVPHQRQHDTNSCLNHKSFNNFKSFIYIHNTHGSEIPITFSEQPWEHWADS